MKQSILALAIMSSTLTFAQVSPLQGHQSTDITKAEGESLWNSMNTSFESKSECYNRAQSWTYDINKKFGFEGKKILIHYSLKYNQELSSKWGYHIAPVYQTEGTDIVYDKGFQPWLHAPLDKKMWEENFLAAGTEELVEKRIKLTDKVSDLEARNSQLNTSDSIQRDEYLSNKKKIAEYNAEIKDFGITDADLLEQKPKKLAQVNKWISYYQDEIIRLRSDRSLVEKLKTKLRYQEQLLNKVETDLNYAAYIECKKITNIEELDFNLKGGWCFIQEVSQYYWGVPQLRQLNYGISQIRDIPAQSELTSAHRAGEDFVQTEYDMNQVWIARKQAFGNDYKEIWKKEYDLKEASADAVSDIYDIVKDASKEMKSSEKYLAKALKEAEGNKAVEDIITKINTLVSQNKEKLQSIITAQEKIYAVSQSLKVEDTETKVNSFNSAKAAISLMERNTESVKDSVSIIKDKIRAIERAQRDAARERRRNSRS
jgi:G:T/U-mismatch repair DNA glycosylase